MLAPWNPNRPATRMAGGISAGRSGETLFHKGEHIPPGLAPWNESGAAEHLPFGSFAIRLAQNLYHRGDVIPLGRTPWNLYHSPVFMSPGTHPIPSGHNLYQQTDCIPPGIYIFSEGFVKSSISLQGGWSFFTISLRFECFALCA